MARKLPPTYVEQEKKRLEHLDRRTRRTSPREESLEPTRLQVLELNTTLLYSRLDNLSDRLDRDKELRRNLETMSNLRVLLHEKGHKVFESGPIRFGFPTILTLAYNHQANEGIADFTRAADNLKMPPRLYVSRELSYLIE